MSYAGMPLCDRYSLKRALNGKSKAHKIDVAGAKKTVPRGFNTSSMPEPKSIAPNRITCPRSHRNWCYEIDANAPRTSKSLPGIEIGTLGHRN